MLEIIIIVLCLFLFFIGFYTIITKRDLFEGENEKKLRESLKDEFIIDPETGAKLTLEEAQSGNWLVHDNEFRATPQHELDKIPYEKERQIEIALNHLKESRYFTKYRFNDFEVKTIEETKILSGYDDWSYSNCFKFERGFIFMPYVNYGRGNNYFENHLMLWLKIESIDGHYTFREKTGTEKFFDSIRNDDEIKLKDYECFTVSKTLNPIRTINLVNKIVKLKGLEIEIHNENLFIKTLNLASLEDVKTLEVLISKLL